jgi:transposase
MSPFLKITLYKYFISCILQVMKELTVKQFNEQYSDDDQCLETVFMRRYGNAGICPKCGVVDATFYRLKSRKCYSCKDCHQHIYPLANTIFHKSETSLSSWFYVIYQVATSKNGVAAQELSRQLGVTYKTAFRMAHRVRALMVQGDELLTGIVEADETYYGGKTSEKRGRFSNKTPIMGLVEKGGFARALVLDHHPNSTTAMYWLRDNITHGATLHTDESRIYSWATKYFIHAFVNHSQHEYVKAGVHTNSIEGLWGNLKRSIGGTHHHVTDKYLQLYVDEVMFRYNLREVSVFPALAELAVMPLVQLPTANGAFNYRPVA